MSKPTRRRVVRGLIAGTVIGAHAVKAAPATTSTSQPAISPAEIATADKLAGREYADDAERQMMAGNLESMRSTLRRQRAKKIPPSVDSVLAFNPLPAGAEKPTGPSSFKLSDAGLLDYNGDPKSLAFATAARLSALLQARKVGSLDLTRMYLDRLKTIGPKLNCVITLTETLALQQARRADEELTADKSRGPLHGIPWGAKDLLATKGIPTTWGVKPYVDQVFDEDADVVKRLEAAGAVLLAKLSLGELAMGDVWFKGMTRNPWKPSEGSSGSSAGPGAATAAGLVGFAIGSETLGSIVSPSVTCGVTGLRPTFGSVSRRGAMSLAFTMDKLGPMCRGVEDCALVFHAIKDADVPFAWDGGKPLSALRVGIDAEAFAGVKSAPIRKLHESAIATLRTLVGELKPINLPPADAYTGLTRITIGSESSSSFSELLTSGQIRELRQQDDGSWPNSFRVGATIPAADYLRAQRLRAQLQVMMADTMKDLDAYITVPFAGGTMAVTNLTGHPSLATRCGMLNNRPLTIEFIGALYGESNLLHLARAFSQAAVGMPIWPDTDKLPDLSD